MVLKGEIGKNSQVDSHTLLEHRLQKLQIFSHSLKLNNVPHNINEIILIHEDADKSSTFHSLV